MAPDPLLLLPVRMETRFERGPAGSELWVRVFPDQIAIDGHDPRLTAAEADAARRWWETLWRAGPDDADARRGAWRSLAQRFGPTRAAYLIHTPLVTPANPADRPAAAVPAGTPLAPAPDFPAVAAADTRPASPAQGPRALALPDHWTVTLIRGGVVVYRADSGPIAPGLAVGPDPAMPPTPTPDGLVVDDGIRWMVDFDEALAAGMALRIPIVDADVRAGFDRVLVHGVAAAADGPALMRELVDVHRFTDGFALVPQGSPTNNTTDAAAGWTRTDPGFDRSFALEVEPPDAMHDGQVLADFLGLPADTVERAGYAARRDQDNARQMSLALWPATFGYFLEQMMPEVFNSRYHEQLRAWVLELVRGRGNLPAVRVGDTPYGIVPTTALMTLAPPNLGRLGAVMFDLLKRLWPVWARSIQLAPHIRRDGDHDAQLVAILGMDASSRAYRARHAFGEEFLRHFAAWLVVNKDETESDFIEDPGKAELAKLGLAGWDPRLIHLALSLVDRPVPFATVDERKLPLSETDGLPPVALPDGSTGNYISWLRHAPQAAIEDDEHKFPGGVPPATLLYKVLRHAVLTEYGKLAWSLVSRRGPPPLQTREREFVGFSNDVAAGRRTVWEALATPISVGDEGEATIGEYIWLQAQLRLPEYRRLWELFDALDWLAGLPTAELDRLFTETLDTYSHRIDPWITSVALAVDRVRRGAAPRTYRVGAYGWTEQLRAKARPPEVTGVLRDRVLQVDALRHERFPTAPPPRPALMPEQDSAGFIHAPSLAQAEAGAVLRNGYLTHADSSNGRLLAVDIASERTRVALDILDGIRQGQSLKALLGYRFERALIGAGMQVLVQPFRDAFPVVANKLTQPAGPVEAVAASNVVDGIALHQRWKAGALWPGPFGASAAQRGVIDGFIAALDDALDALGDLSIGESVFQIMRGNPVKAGGLLDAISRGERPPDPELVRTPRAGLDLTHRLVLLMTPGPARAAGWPAAANARAAAEPRLDAWVSTLLPAPAHVRCRVGYKQPVAAGGEVVVTLAELALDPLDVVALAAGADEHATDVELRVLLAARAALPADATDLAIIFERDPAWGATVRTFPELLVVARSVHALLAGSRALTPQDLVEPERLAEAEGAALDNAELKARADAGLAAVDAAASALEAAVTDADLRDALVAGSLFGVAGGVPDPAVVAKDQATALAAGLRKRIAAAQAAQAAFDPATATPATTRDHLAGQLGAVFGDDFTVCPRFAPAAAADLGSAFAASASLLNGDDDAPERWLAQLAPVRPGAGRWAAVRGGAQLLARRYPPGARIAQLPLLSPDRWLALPLVPGAPPPPQGRVSIVAEVHPAHNPAQPHCGLMLDEWPERIPATEQSTGLAFHFDQPNAQAPQALLMALCPDDRPAWDADAIEAVLNETLDRGKARAVDLESIGELGQLLPTLLFPFNADGQTVSLRFEDIH